MNKCLQIAITSKCGLLFSFSAAITLKTDWFSYWLRLTLSFSIIHKLNKKIVFFIEMYRLYTTYT